MMAILIILFHTSLKKIDFIAYTLPMKISKVDPYNLIVEDNPLYPGIVGVPLSMIALYKLIQLISEGNVFNKEFFGTLVCFIITLFVTGFMTQFRKFHFNVGEKHLYWRRIGLFGFKSGAVPFSNIKKSCLRRPPHGERERLMQPSDWHSPRTRGQSL